MQRRNGLPGPDAASGAGWSGDLVRQLGFIKKKLRYPVSLRTARPLLILGASMAALGFVLHTFVFTGTRSHKAAWFPAALVVVMLIPMMVMVIRYFTTLRFVAVPAAGSVAENMQLIERFLRSRQLAIGRHPEAPEVFQISSQSIRALKGEREIVIFIADDRRILVNSHFTQSGLSTPVGSPQYRQIAGMLREWIIARNRSGSELGKPL